MLCIDGYNLFQTASERTSNIGLSRAAIGQSEGRCTMACTGHPHCRTPPGLFCMVVQPLDFSTPPDRCWQSLATVEAEVPSGKAFPIFKTFDYVNFRVVSIQSGIVVV